MTMLARKGFGMRRFVGASSLILGLVFLGHASARAWAEEEDPSALDGLIELLAQADEADFQLDLLKGMRDGLKGRKSVTMPAGWRAVYAKLAASRTAEVREQATLLALVFGDPQALVLLRKVMQDLDRPAAEREAALQALVERRTADLASVLHKLLGDRAMRAPALRGLGAYDHKATPQIVLNHYHALSTEEKQDAIGTLASRPAYATALLEAVEKGKVPRGDISAFIARQLLNFGDPKLNEKLTAVWGEIRPTSKDKQAVIGKYKTMLTAQHLKEANLSAGRLVFNRTCVQCHMLYGVGGKIGPDLTGSNRANLDYVLENALDPSAVIGRDYRLSIVILDDGRLVNGIVVEETDRAVTVQTVNERLVLSKEDIEEMSASPISMMPEGQLEKLTETELRDLVAYLATPTQVPLPDPPVQE